MKVLRYTGFFLLSFLITACGFNWFPDQEEADVFSNVYSSRFRKRPPNAVVGKCYEKYIKSPYKYTCINRATSYFDEDNSANKAFNIIKNPNSRIKSTNPLWVEVICERGIHSDFAERLNAKLINAGFLNPKNVRNRRIIDFRTKTALTKYQRFYCLPQGTLNMETLLHLGV